MLVSVFQVPTAFIALALLGKKFAILSRKLDLVTVTDFLRHRYEHPAVVIIASLGVVLFLVAYMVPQFVGGARVLQAVTGVDYNTLLIVFAGVVLRLHRVRRVPRGRDQRHRAGRHHAARRRGAVGRAAGGGRRPRTDQLRGDRASTPSCSRSPGPAGSPRR